MLPALLALTPFVSAAPLSVDAVSDPRARDSWVVDEADVLTPEQEAAIDARLDLLQADTGAEIAVVALSSVDQEPKAFATALFNRWGVGREGVDDGVLVLLVVDARRVEIETGYGAEERVPDGVAGRILDQHAIPRFKAGDYGGGLMATVGVLDHRMRGEPGTDADGSLAQTGPTPGASPGPGRPGPVPWVPLGGAGAVLAGLVGVGARRQWVAARTCPDCGQRMTKLDEVADDAHLKPGQITEERIGSRDYEVRVCAEHDRVKVFPHTKWLSFYSACGHCRNRTAKSSSRTISAATTTSTGLVEVTTSCEHCGRSSTTTRVTARLPEPSSSSGSSGGSSYSGGSSFGGGSSGGGGAGRSW